MDRAVAETTETRNVRSAIIRASPTSIARQQKELAVETEGALSNLQHATSTLHQYAAVTGGHMAMNARQNLLERISISRENVALILTYVSQMIGLVPFEMAFDSASILKATTVSVLTAVATYTSTASSTALVTQMSVLKHVSTMWDQTLPALYLALILAAQIASVAAFTQAAPSTAATEAISIAITPTSLVRVLSREPQLRRLSTHSSWSVPRLKI